MKINNLQDLDIFVKTAECGGLSAAARMLDISPAVASAALKRLESSLNVALFMRTTRSMRLTLEGETLLTRCKPLLEGLREVESEVNTGKALVNGNLQISMPSDLGRNVILPWLDEFQNKYPDVHLRVQISDRVADVYRQPVDIALRYGVPASSGLIAFPLVPDNRRVLCAAPTYLKKYGRPNGPQDLKAHNCLCLMINEAIYNNWRFSRGDEEISVNVHGDRFSDDSDAVRRWSTAGYGLIYRSYLDVAKDIDEGRLEIVCPEWIGEKFPLYLVCADRRFITATVRLLREFLEEKFGFIKEN